ncbi:MAG: hypothetical protein WC364_02265 [Eubacteriales bacterium]|jgi:hypothetical protein
MESRTVYFEEIRPENTFETFKLVEERLRGRDIKKIVIASTTGATAIKALDFFKDQGVKIIVVPHQFGFREKNYFPEELVKTIRGTGHEVHFGTMLFHTDNFYGSGAPALMANLLRCFSQGVKVCFEITLMASDACLLTSGEKVAACQKARAGAPIRRLLCRRLRHRTLKGSGLMKLSASPLTALAPMNRKTALLRCGI